MTPLHIAAYIGDYKVIKLLLLYFADANIKDIYGKIPLDYARERGYGKAIDALKNSIYRNNSARHNMLYHKQIFHKNSKSSMLLPPDFYNNSPNNSILQNYSTLTNNIYSSPIKKKLFNNHSNTKSNKSTPNLYIRKVVSRTKSFSSINSNIKMNSESNISKDLIPSQESVLICHPDIHDSFPWTISENGKIMIKVDMNKIEEDPDNETIIKAKFIDGNLEKIIPSQKNDIIIIDFSINYNLSNSISISLPNKNFNNTLNNSIKKPQQVNNIQNSYEFIDKFIKEQEEGEIKDLIEDLNNENNSDSEDALQIIEPEQHNNLTSQDLNNNSQDFNLNKSNNLNKSESESLTYTYSSNSSFVKISKKNNKNENNNNSNNTNKKNKEKNINTETGTLSSITLIDDEQIKANLYIFLQEINMENYTDILVNQGFDDVRLMVNQMNTGYALTDENLKEVGIIKAGDRAKILIRLQELSGGFDFNIPFNSVYYINKKEYSKVKYDFKIKALLDWLREIKLGDLLENFYNNGYHSIDLLYVQMYSKNPINEQILEQDLNIKKLGYRTRLMNKIQENAKKYISELKNSKKKEMNNKNNFIGEACKCIIF